MATIQIRNENSPQPNALMPRELASLPISIPMIAATTTPKKVPCHYSIYMLLRFYQFYLG